jgi:hypothetical protein
VIQTYAQWELNIQGLIKSQKCFKMLIWFICFERGNRKKAEKGRKNACGLQRCETDLRGSTRETMSSFSDDGMNLQTAGKGFLQ